jgi:hypothetical protein
MLHGKSRPSVAASRAARNDREINEHRHDDNVRQERAAVCRRVGAHRRHAGGTAARAPRCGDCRTRCAALRSRMVAQVERADFAAGALVRRRHGESLLAGGCGARNARVIVSVAR